MDRRFAQRVLVAKVGQIIAVIDLRGRYLGAAIGEQIVLPHEPPELSYRAWTRQRTLRRARRRGTDGRTRAARLFA